MKILFVCHGNICRSPMAEFVMKDLLKKAGRDDVVAGCTALMMNMKMMIVVGGLVLATSVGAGTVHRSFRNGYPAGAQGVTVRQQPNAGVLRAPKMPQGGTKVVTNRVVLTKEQAEKLLKSKKGIRVRKIKVEATGKTAN